VPRVQARHLPRRICHEIAAFSAHAASDVHAAAAPVFAELIAGSDVIIGETLMAKGLGG
jgi:hypothetical protein